MPGNIRRIGSRLWLLSLIGFPFSLYRPRGSVGLARRRVFRERVGNQPWFARGLAYLLATLLWPVGALLYTAALSRDIRTGRLAGALRMYLYALRFNVPPVEYVAYGFDRADRRRQWADYFYWFDLPMLAMLNRGRNARTDDVQDKRRFAYICEARGYPHVEALRQAQIEGSDGKADDVWLKKIGGLAGAGAESWQRREGNYFSKTGRLTPRELWDYASQNGLLIQSRLRNHAKIEPLTNGALASLRLVTALHRDGRVSFLGNMLLLPQGDRIHSGGGRGFAVSWLNGRIARSLPNVPATLAARACGTVLPFWPDCLKLVRQAHREAFASFATLGWDIALTPNGPVLLETNAGWGALHLQQLWGPLGRTAFAALLDEELARQPAF